MHGRILLAVLAGLQLSCQLLSSPEAASVQYMDEPPLITNSKGAVTPGRYVGYLRSKLRDQKFPVTMDLVAVNRDRHALALKGITRVLMGGYFSQEFLSVYHETVNFNIKDSSFYFAPSQNELRITDASLKGGSIIVGKLQDRNLNEVGDFLVIYRGDRRPVRLGELVEKVYPDQTVVPTLAGHYEGTCAAKQTTLDIDTSRWHRDQVSSADEFPGYRITAEWGVVNNALCGDKSGSCLRAAYSNGGFEPFTGKLTLKGETGRKSCVAAGSNLLCGACLLTKVEAPYHESADLKRLMHRAQRLRPNSKLKNLPIASVAKHRGLDREYRGYLFHERTGQYQLLRFRTKSQDLGSKSKSSVLVGAVATLFFGDESANEFSVYQFPERFVGETGKYAVFDGDGEAFIQVSHWTGRNVKGIWYSKSYGRIGTFELSSGKIPKVPRNAALLSSLSGRYESGKYEFRLAALSEVSREERQVFPLMVRGLAASSVAGERRHTIMSASYQFYDGVISFVLDDGRVISGTSKAKGFELSWPNRQTFGSVIQAKTKDFYRYSRESVPDTAQLRQFLQLRQPHRLKL